MESSDAACEVCNEVRGFIYTGSVYAEEDLNLICPWCISDGSAHKKFDAEFVDPAGVSGYRQWSDVRQEIVEEVAYRTPGFNGWQQERWWTHCDDAAEFLGPAGRKELEAFGDEAMSAIQEEGGLSDEAWEEYFQVLAKDSSPTAYIFRCRHCGALGGYSD